MAGETLRREALAYGVLQKLDPLMARTSNSSSDSNRYNTSRHRGSLGGAGGQAANDNLQQPGSAQGAAASERGWQSIAASTPTDRFGSSRGPSGTLASQSSSKQQVFGTPGGQQGSGRRARGWPDAPTQSQPATDRPPHAARSQPSSFGPAATTGFGTTPRARNSSKGLQRQASKQNDDPASS
jgi:hypothetical protein